MKRSQEKNTDGTRGLTNVEGGKDPTQTIHIEPEQLQQRSPLLGIQHLHHVEGHEESREEEEGIRGEVASQIHLQTQPR